MGQGYTRNDTSNNITDGNIINASDLDGEFDAVEAAFNSSTGHTHDGTSAEGGAITVLGPVQDFVASATEIRPKTTNTLDIGTGSLQFKDLHLDGTAYLDDVQAVGAVDITGDLDIDNININGNTIISTNTNGNIALTPNGTGEVDISKVDIASGEIDGTTIGGTTPAAGTFTTATVNGDLTVDANTLFVDSTNNRVGISTPSPTEKLHVDGQVKSSGGYYVGSTNTYIYEGASDTLNIRVGSDGPYVEFIDAGSNVLEFGNSSDALALTSAGTERMRIDNIGSVGIGTSLAIAKLDVNNVIFARPSNTASASEVKAVASDYLSTPSFTNTGVTQYGSTATGTTLGLSNASLGMLEFINCNNAAIFTNGSTPIVFGTTSTERMRITSGGNVGIGTSSPSSDAIARFIAIDNATSSGLVLDGARKFSMYSSSSSTLAFRDETAGTNRMAIDSSGNVGIGTSSPEAKTSIVSSAGAIGLTVKDANAGANNYLSAQYNGTSGVADIKSQSSSGSTQIAFSTSSSGATAERMRIDSSGNLLVGYTSSNGSYKLQVNSQIFATSATIATSDGNYKENITPLDGALSLVSQLNPVQFDWKEHPVHEFDRNQPTIGFIAQEVQQVLAEQPYLNSIVKSNECVLEPEETDDEGNVIKEAVTESFLGIAEGNMVALLTAAIKEQQELIQSLTDRIAALENA